jgi:hypothetical protein
MCVWRKLVIQVFTIFRTIKYIIDCYKVGSEIVKIFSPSQEHSDASEKASRNEVNTHHILLHCVRLTYKLSEGERKQEGNNIKIIRAIVIRALAMLMDFCS